MSGHQLGFLSVRHDTEGGLACGLLVTDMRGIPLEFRHTSRLKPTTLQKLLYGESLNQSVGQTCFVEPLLRETNSRIDLIFIDFRHVMFFKDLCENDARVAVLFTESATESLGLRAVMLGGELVEGIEFVDQTCGGQPVAISFSASNLRAVEIADECASQFQFFPTLNRIQNVLLEISKVK